MSASPWDLLLKDPKELKEFRESLAPKQTGGWVPSPSHSPGELVGQWTLLEYIPGTMNPKTNARWLCRCSCGVEKEVLNVNLINGTSKSCGHAKFTNRKPIL